MKRTVTVHTSTGDELLEYDDEHPCRVCGEPIISPSMNGTEICPWCDIGRCRYCNKSIMVLKEHIDGGRSMKEIRQHMEHHRELQPMRVPIPIIKINEE